MTTINEINSTTPWILGVDVGQRSVGLAAVEVNEEGSPKEILAAVSVIHDAGIDDEKTLTSRLAQAGVARRLHRLRRRRRARLNKVDQLIKRFGWKLPPSTGEHPYAAWQARKQLVEQRVTDPDQLNLLLGRAISHISRHRGWRNPWLSLAALKKLEAPSQTLKESIERARTDTGSTLEPGTLGQLGALLLDHAGHRLNPSDRAASQPALLAGKARQEDLLWELHQIWKMQELSLDSFETVIEAVFSQVAPSVPRERIGIDPLDSNQVRAPIACLEFQLFRILDKVANLRIVKDGERIALDNDQRHKVVQHLMNTREERITWAEVATDILGLPTEADLVVPEEQRISSLAPRDETTTAVEKYLKDNRKNLAKTKSWWEQATGTERAALIAILVDSEDTDDMGIATILPPDELTLLAEIHLPPGRAAYGRRTLQRLNEKMSAEPIDLHAARKACFGVSDDWHPPLPRLEDPTGHPTVDRNVAAVRKFLSSAEIKWGPPKQIVIEIVREAEQSPATLRKEETKRAKRRESNERMREELQGSGVPQPTRADLNRNKLLSLYNCHCLYCGDGISWDTSELDHIVPQKDAGSNRLENLAAVCVTCNRRKSGRPFGLYAKLDNLNLQEVIGRVDELRYERGGFWEDKQELASYKRAVKARLRRLTPDPEEIRPMEPTSYAATALRDRLKRYTEDLPSSPDLYVFSGGITAEARWVLNLDTAKVLERRGFGKRLDRRHHAVDALVLTTLRPGVAQRLLKRRAIRTQQEFYKGSTAIDLSKWESEVQNNPIFQDWLERGKALVGLLREAIESDAISVMTPLRLRARGQLHKETGRKLEHREIGAAWSDQDIRRIVDQKAYMGMAELAEDGNALDEDDKRTLTLNNRTLSANEQLDLFPENRAMMKVGTWAVDMGEIHHARIYAWKDTNGNINYAWLRVWLADLAVCNLLRPRVDIFSEPLPPWSQSWRQASDNLRNAHKEGAAVCLGWVVGGDELEFRAIESVPGRGPIRTFLQSFPERHWVITSLMSANQIRLKPRYIAAEGIDTNVIDETCKTIIERGWQPSVTTIFGSQDLTIVRRTSLGAPRWNHAHLPVSWSPARRAKDLLS